MLHQLEADPSGTRLREDERALVLDETAARLSQPLPPALEAAYTRLSEAAEDGAVPPALEEPLQALLEVGMESGRIRAVHGAHAEMAAARLYARLPRGRLYKQSLDAANEALATFVGHEIVETSLSSRGPGSCTLTLSAGSRRINISIRRSGVSVESVEAVI